MFNDKQLVVSGDSSTTRIILEAVCCIEFNTSADLNFSFPSHIANIMVLSKDKFLKAIESESVKCEAMSDRRQGTQPVSIFIEIMMKDGSHWYLRVIAETLQPIERIELTKIVCDLTGFHAIKSSGGAVLFNMKNIVSWTTHPTALLSSQKTWKIEKS